MSQQIEFRSWMFEQRFSYFYHPLKNVHVYTFHDLSRLVERRDGVDILISEEVGMSRLQARGLIEAVEDEKKRTSPTKKRSMKLSQKWSESKKKTMTTPELGKKKQTLSTADMEQKKKEAHAALLAAQRETRRIERARRQEISAEARKKRQALREAARLARLAEMDKLDAQSAARRREWEAMLSARRIRGHEGDGEANDLAEGVLHMCTGQSGIIGSAGFDRASPLGVFMTREKWEPRYVFFDRSSHVIEVYNAGGPFDPVTNEPFWRRKHWVPISASEVADDDGDERDTHNEGKKADEFGEMTLPTPYLEFSCIVGGETVSLPPTGLLCRRNQFEVEVLNAAIGGDENRNSGNTKANTQHNGYVRRSSCVLVRHDDAESEDEAIDGHGDRSMQRKSKTAPSSVGVGAVRVLAFAARNSEECARWCSELRFDDIAAMKSIRRSIQEQELLHHSSKLPSNPSFSSVAPPSPMGTVEVSESHLGMRSTIDRNKRRSKSASPRPNMRAAHPLHLTSTSGYSVARRQMNPTFATANPVVTSDVSEGPNKKIFIREGSLTNEPFAPLTKAEKKEYRNLRARKKKYDDNDGGKLIMTIAETERYKTLKTRLKATLKAKNSSKDTSKDLEMARMVKDYHFTGNEDEAKSDDDSEMFVEMPTSLGSFNIPGKSAHQKSEPKINDGRSWGFPSYFRKSR